MCERDVRVAFFATTFSVLEKVAEISNSAIRMYSDWSHLYIYKSHRVQHSKWEICWQSAVTAMLADT